MMKNKQMKQRSHHQRRNTQKHVPPSLMSKKKWRRNPLIGLLRMNSKNLEIRTSLPVLLLQDPDEENEDKRPLLMGFHIQNVWHQSVCGIWFIMRVLPIEVACYASEEEISRAITPVVEKYFPVDTQDPLKIAVMYEARANSGIDRMKIINSVAQSVPEPHKVDLGNPDKTIVVEIVKTVCLIGVIEKYELSKYNLRQLTS